MLYIVQTDKEIGWHVGDKLSQIVDTPRNLFINGVTEVQADGDELVHLIGIFGTSIPISNKRVNNWYGDTAKTIVSALFQ